MTEMTLQGNGDGDGATPAWDCVGCGVWAGYEAWVHAEGAKLAGSSMMSLFQLIHAMFHALLSSGTHVAHVAFSEKLC